MLLHLWVVSLLLNVIPGILFALAQTEVTSILAGIINAVTPLMTLLAIMAVTRDEKPKLYQVVGILIGFIGVLTVLGAWKGLGDNPLWAILILLAAVTCYGFSFPYSRRFVLPHKLAPESIAAGQVTLGALTLLPFFIYNGVEKYEYQTAPVLAMLALGVFGSGFAYIWNFKVMALAGSAIASSVTYLTPVVAVIVGVIFLQESIYWYEPVGALIVLLGAAIGQNRIKLSAAK
jgi:drug/metabolite transporter (DMT)-like permease